MSELEVHVEASHCIRCGACAAACPGVFDVSGKVSRAQRQPTASERVFVEAARWICPTDAVRAARDDATRDVAGQALGAALFDELAAGAERVRWTLDAIPWQDLDAASAPADLRMVVREMAFSENATYSATQRFMDAFFDDVDFTRWISVWFYEETKHPHVLTEWLRRIGEPVATDFVLKGRVSTPFMRSIVGTLVTNLISEITAAQAYRHLSRTSPEPVLGKIAGLIAGDEARHAASFFRFASRALAMAPRDTVRRDRARGLEVLQAWLGGATPTTHPVAQMIERLHGLEDAHGYMGTSVRTRVVRVVGLLLDLPLRRDEDVPVALRDILGGRS